MIMLQRIPSIVTALNKTRGKFCCCGIVSRLAFNTAIFLFQDRKLLSVSGDVSPEQFILM